MSHIGGLPALHHHGEYAPNSHGNKASRSFQMEAQLALNQLVFDADQRRSRYVGVSNMHEVSEHAEEAQRLAQQLLNRMSGGYGNYDSPDRNRLPPLRSTVAKYGGGAPARPSLAAAKKYAIQRSPTRSPQQSPLRQGDRSSAPNRPREHAPHQQLHESNERRVLDKEQHANHHAQGHRSDEPPQHLQQLRPPPQRHVEHSEALTKEQHQHLQQHQSPSLRQPQSTHSLRPMGLQAAVAPASSSPSTRKTTKVMQRQPARNIPNARTIPPISQRSQHDPHQWEAQRRARTPPTAQLVETESVERSILITVWQLERSKLLVRINKAIASYFSWLMEDLENEMLSAKELIEAEEEHIWATTIWNKTVIKISGFRSWQVDHLFQIEEDNRSAIAREEGSTVGLIPSLAGHDKYTFFENEYRSRCEVRDAEESRRTIITTKFKLLEAVVDESNLRKWIETLENEMFENTIRKPLQSMAHVNEGAAIICRREVRDRASIVAELENEFLYFDRYSTNLSSLCHDTKFWNEKRDIEYHENLRRLFSIASQEQERQELLKSFFSFMMAKGAVLSKRALDTVLDNEWIRRGLMQTMELRERSTIDIAFLHVMHDAVSDRRTRQHEDARAVVSEYDGRAQTAEDVVHHESIRRGFLIVQQQRDRNSVESLIRSLNNVEEVEYNEPVERVTTTTPSDAEGIDAHESNRRRYLEAAEGNERRSYVKLHAKEIHYLQREDELSLLSSEQVRRVFTQRDEQASWRILSDLSASNRRDTTELMLSRTRDNEALRRSILIAGETQARCQMVAANSIHADSDDDACDVIDAQKRRSSVESEAKELARLVESDQQLQLQRQVDSTARSDGPSYMETTVGFTEVPANVLGDEAAAIAGLRVREERLNPSPTSPVSPSRSEDIVINDGASDKMAATVTLDDVKAEELRCEAAVLAALGARESELSLLRTFTGTPRDAELRDEASEIARICSNEQELESQRHEVILFHESFVLSVLKASLEEVDQRQQMFNDFQTNQRET